MQAYKLKGKVDSKGKLVITEPVNLPVGDVDIIILQAKGIVVNATITNIESQPETLKKKSRVKAFQDLLENTSPAPPDFDPDRAKWEYLKEKHNL